MAKEDKGIRAEKKDFSEWYGEVVVKSGMADYSAVSGCMVIRPYGYAVWEKITEYLNMKLKESGHKNAYFPLFIPERFLKREAEHFEGFMPEVAWIEKKEEKEERFALRPTSETIIYDSFSKWIRSWRDLPLKVNQWANIVRWETKATKPFIRTREFLWQEGHTAHSSEKEAENEVFFIVDLYKELIEGLLAVPVLIGRKTEREKFSGAVYTVTLESFMPDGKALQMGTSHNLGQNFSKPFGVKYLDRDEKEKYAWITSWGVSTRLIGAVIMVHGDDKGLVLPPKVAPIQIVIVPIIFEEHKKDVFNACKKVEKMLSGFSVFCDTREEHSAGWKFNEWELKGVPLRIEIGPNEVKSGTVLIVRRDTGEKRTVKAERVKQEAEKILEDIQKSLFENAKRRLKENTKNANSYEELKEFIKKKKLVKACWCGEIECEKAMQEETTATIRLVTEEKPSGKCVRCGKKAENVVYIAKAY